MDIEKCLISEDKIDYKCFDILKSLLKEDEHFKNVILNGLKENKVMGFPAELWEKIRLQNIRGIDNFETFFKEGYNIGNCTNTARQLSYSFPYCYICAGILPLLKGTLNCPRGEHNWLSYNGKVIDTSLMLIINESYAKNLGYGEVFRQNPEVDPIYRCTKEFTNDIHLRGK